MARLRSGRRSLRFARDGHRTAAVIESIRAIFKKDARNRTSLDVNDLVGEAVALTRSDLQRYQIEVQVEPDAQVPQEEIESSCSRCF
jgi:signal transduction histidine kinase